MRSHLEQGRHMYGVDHEIVMLVQKPDLTPSDGWGDSSFCIPLHCMKIDKPGYLQCSNIQYHRDMAAIEAFCKS